MIIHHQVLALAFDHKMIGDTRQVGVAQGGQDDGFAPELAGIFFGGKEVFFDGDFNAQVLIHSAINSTHAPLAEDFDDPITFI